MLLIDHLYGTGRRARDVPLNGIPYVVAHGTRVSEIIRGSQCHGFRDQHGEIPLEIEMVYMPRDSNCGGTKTSILT